MCTDAEISTDFNWLDGIQDVTSNCKYVVADPGGAEGVYGHPAL